MSFPPVRPAKSQLPSQTRAAGIDLGNLGQLSGPGWLDHSLSPYAAYGATGSPAPDAASGPAELATAYPLALAALQTALEFLDIGCSRTGRLFNQQDLLAPGQPPWGSLDQGALAAVSPRPSHRESAAALQRPARNPTALTLSAPIAGSGDLILAARRPSPATNQRVQARAQTRPARQKPIYRHSWLRTATKSPTFALSSAAINGLMLLSPLVSFADPMIYGDGGTSNIYPTPGTINSGNTVILNNNATVESAGVITVDGTLQFNQTEPLYIENLITGNGVLSLTNTGILYLIGDKTYTGNTSIDLGTLVVLGSLAGSNVSVDTGATFQVDEAATIGSIAGNGTINLNWLVHLTAGGSNSTTTFSGVMLDDPQYPQYPGSFTKAGTGTLTLSGTNTYTGATTISAGTLQIGAGGTSGAISDLSSIVNNANLAFNRSDTTSYAGAISGSGNLTQLGSGSLTLSGTNNYTGNTSIVSGTLLVSGSLADSSNVSVATGATYQLGASDTVGSIAGNGTINLDSYNLTAGAANASTTFSGVLVGTGSFTKVGTGTLLLVGNNTYTGGTTLAGGTLSLGSNQALGTIGTISFSGGSLQFTENNTSDYSARFSQADNQAYAIDTNGQNISLATGLTSAGGSLTKQGTGTLTLTGNNTHTGTTTISAGTLQIGAGGNSGAISNSSNITNNANLAFNRSNDYTYGGLISGGGTLGQLGAGTLTLSGTNTYTGTTTVSAGTLQVQGSIAPSSGLTVNSGATLSGNGSITGTTINAGGILAPNNAGSSALAITGGSGSLTLASGSISNFLITSLSSDRVTASGSINLDGVLNLAFSGDDSYLTATPYILFSGQSRSGSFGSVVVSGLSDSYLYSLDYAANALNLWLVATVPAGQSIDISTTTSTTLSGGTLLINDPGAYNTSVVLANPTGSATTNTINGNGLTAVLSGTISGTGPLTFTNQNSTTISNTILSGNNTYTGATVVDGGARLSVNGSIASSANLTVNAGAIIGGNGTLPATTIQSGGYLAPGNSIGLLTAASLDFGPVAPGGILVAEFQGPQNDKTTVTGSVTNFTGTANLSPFGGGNPWPNFDYQLITATNNFTTSSSLTLTPVGITSALLLKGTTPVQEVDGNAKTFDVMWRPNNGSGATASAMAALGQGNRNQLAASGVFDSAFRRLASAAGDASGLTTGLNATGSAIGTTGFTTGQAAAAGLSPEFLSTTAQLLGISSNSQLSAAVSTITPESYAAFQSVGLETLQRQRQQLLASAGQCASTGWVINAPTTKAAKAPKNPICLYGQAANANSSINGQDGLSSYNANLFSSFYGLEVKANPYWRFGAAYGYGTSNLNGLGLTNAWVTATVNSGSLYGVYTPTTTSPWTFKGLLGYGNYALNGSRQVAVVGTGTPITGSTTANGLTAALTAEVAIPLSKPSAPVPVLLKPLIGLAYGNYQQAGFSETGGGPLNLNVDGNSASSLVGTIGIELTSGPIPLNKAKSISLIPKLALAYQVDALASETGNSSLSASMPASGSGSFLTQGQNRGVNGFTIAAGADLALSQSTALYANVNVEAFSSGNQLGYGGGFRFKF